MSRHVGISISQTLHSRNRFQQLPPMTFHTSPRINLDFCCLRHILSIPSFVFPIEPTWPSGEYQGVTTYFLLPPSSSVPSPSLGGDFHIGTDKSLQEHASSSIRQNLIHSQTLTHFFKLDWCELLFRIPTGFCDAGST